MPRRPALIHPTKHSLAILGATFAALALLAGCTTSRLVTQQSNPDYVGKSFKSIMVVAVTADEIVRRTYEDRIVALLGQRGRKGVPAYSVLGTRGKVEEAELRQAVAKSGVEGVLTTRITRVDRSSAHIPGATVAVGIGIGGVGLYGASGMWQTVSLPAQDIAGSSWTYSETRLFDAKSGALAWTGIMESRETHDLDAALTQYIEVIFDAMVDDRVL